ncbi:ABC transporter permease [Variovorax sp. Sphag1AA]|uniref:ABC transporter permease n=1 Tax=Variovorax sp. Sphag1AA TaxID=2587027 RepID=UPI00160DA4FF|nr:ABC transporter permease [Variovorax sp. Sphag1AA]MBB3177132.1 lipopolysaccharide transport system permease protein [Variovorax sp. Sphag1AA]
MSTANEPLLVIKPRRRGNLFPLRDVLEYRDLLYILALRDIKLRYRQTAVGVAWVLLQPLIGAGLFTFVFGVIADMPTGDERVPYFVFGYTGLLLWNAFIQIFLKTNDSMVVNSGLVSKIYFPRMVLPISTVYGVMLDFAVGAVVMVVLMVVYSIMPGLPLLFFPVALLLAILFALGLGLCAAALNVSYRDVRHVVPVFSQFLLWASPVAYAASSIPQSVKWLVALNPMVGILDSFRWAILGTPVTSWGSVVWSAVASVLMFIAGLVIFQRSERRFADVI